MQLLGCKISAKCNKSVSFRSPSGRDKSFSVIFSAKVNGATSAIRLGVAKFVDILRIFQPNVATGIHPGEFGEFQLHLSRKVRSQWHLKLDVQSHLKQACKIKASSFAVLLSKTFPLSER